MIATRYIWSFVAALLVSGVASAADQAAAPTKLVGTFSSFNYNTEGGDLNGMEIHLIPTSGGLKAVVQFAEGEPGDLAVVDVVSSGNRIKFHMPAGFSVEGDFDGTISPKELVGKFKHKEGGEEAVHLLRTRSYWDK